MPFGDSSYTDLFIYEETAWGVAETSPPTMQTMRITGESLGQATTLESSQEIRSDRQVPDLIRTDISASGDINFEMSYSDSLLNYLFKGAAMSDWSAADSETASDLTFTASTNTIVSAAAADFSIFEAGQWIRVTGSSNNNGFFKVVSAVTLTITVESGITDEGTADASATIDNDGLMRNGTTKRSYGIEKQLTDVSEFINFLGMRVGSLSLNVAPGAIITGSASFQGKIADAVAATIGDGSPTAAGTNSVMSSIDDVYGIREGGAASSLSFTNLSFTLDNALRPQPAIGTLGAAGMGIGRLSITGQLEAYFENRTLYEKYLDATSTSIDFRLSDGAAEPANSLIVTLPALKFSDGQVMAGGIDQDILASMSFEAKLHATDKMIQFDRFADS